MSSFEGRKNQDKKSQHSAASSHNAKTTYMTRPQPGARASAALMATLLIWSSKSTVTAMRT